MAMAINLHVELEIEYRKYSALYRDQDFFLLNKGINHIVKAKKKIVVFQVPFQKKTGSVGRLYFFFFLLFFC